MFDMLASKPRFKLVRFLLEPAGYGLDEEHNENINGTQKIVDLGNLIGSGNLGSFWDESRSLVFHVFLSVSESQIFFARSWSLGFAFLAEVLWQKLSRWASRASVAEIKQGVYVNGGKTGKCDPVSRNQEHTNLTSRAGSLYN